ncbi:MAG: hypothetical protein DRN59_03195, partial [Thaumarchaeota archaeon]
MYFPKKLVERCGEFVGEHPEVASNVRDFMVRCVRLGFHKLREVYPEDMPKGYAFSEYLPREPRIRVEGDRVRIYFPDREFEIIRDIIVGRLGLVSTATT